MTESTVPKIVAISVWLWGLATVLAASVFLGVASPYISPDGHFSPSAPRWIGSVYVDLDNLNRLVAAILAVSGLALPYFSQRKELIVRCPIRVSMDDRWRE
jgi:hypothetical protein